MLCTSTQDILCQDLQFLPSFANASAGRPRGSSLQKDLREQTFQDAFVGMTEGFPAPEDISQ